MLTELQRMNLELPEYAVEIFDGHFRPGCMLPTRDGRKMGNAHIIGEVKKLQMPNGELQLNKYFVVLTDAGSEMHLCLKEIDELFYLPPYIADVQEVINKFRRKI